MQKFEKKELKKKSESLSDWYSDVILKAELADYAPVKGCMVIRPYGYAIWEGIQKFMDPLYKKHGVANAYFPLLIPEKFINREKDHVEGFAPHMAVVTFAGGEKLKERFVVRPTSETIMYEMYKQWTHSWRDLPILINQWNNVVRWEKRTYLFLRTSEFLWQEGHCAHITHEESLKTVLWALGVYQKTYNELLAMHGIAGVKSESEKFAGALKTYTFESLMPDGRALQACTSHDLGQNFSKAFDWTVQDKNGQNLNPWQNSWGYSTRSIGGLIMMHGDDDGIVLPPRIASIKVVIIPVLGKEDSKVIKLAKDLKEKILQSKSNFPGTVEIWDNPEKTFGFKANASEIKGIPLTIPIGLKEVKGEKPISISYRPSDKDLPNEFSKMENIGEKVELMLYKLQIYLFEKTKKFTEENTHQVDNYDEFKKIMSGKRGFIRSYWCEDKICEAKIKEETKATTRVKPLDAKKEQGKCIYCGKEALYRWYFAQAY